MTKGLHKAIMKRSRLANKFLSDRTEMSRKEYKKATKLLSKPLIKKSQKSTFCKFYAEAAVQRCS